VRTEKAQAPDLLEKLLSLPINHFDLNEVAAALNVTIQQARNIVVFGMTEEKLRLAVPHDATNGRRAKYENPKWRNKWIRGCWKMMNEAKGHDSLV